MTDPDDGDPAGFDPDEADDADGDWAVYHFNDWPPERRDQLTTVLAEAGVAHRWDGDRLRVPSDDEARFHEVLLDVEAAEKRGFPLGEETVVYGIAAWPDALVGPLTRALDEAKIPFGWDADGDLVVPASAEEQVDAIVDELPEPEALELPPIDECTSFDLDDWSDEYLDRLETLLVRAGIAHGWDEEGGLVVPEARADDVESLIDRVEHPNALPVEADDGDVDAQQVLSELFVSADRLRKNPLDPDAAIRLLDASERAGALGTPFGFAATAWEALTERAAEVATLVADRADPDEVAAAAESLRDQVRPLV